MKAILSSLLTYSHPLMAWLHEQRPMKGGVGPRQLELVDLAAAAAGKGLVCV